MNITKEDLNIVFKVEKSVPPDVLEKFDLHLVSESLVRREISQEKHLLEYISEVSPYLIEKEDIEAMLLKTYCIETSDEVEASKFFNSLFLPKFKMEEYALSDVRFYLDIGDETYSINMDYDFENTITIRIAIFLDKEDNYHKILKDFKVIIENVLEEESKNAYSE